jgi:RNA polymerase sigma-54 factor
MRLEQQVRSVQRTVMRPSAQVISFAETLALDASGFDALIEAELAAAPALERGTGPAGWGMRGGGSAVGPHDLLAAQDPRAVLAADLAASLPSQDRPLAARLVAELDERGFLDAPAAEIAALARCDVARVRRAIAVLKELGPSGLATDGPLACVRHQLRAAPVPVAVRDVADRLLASHLPEVAGGDVKGAAAALGVPSDVVEAALAAIRAHTRPTPCWDGAPPSAPQPPDLVVEEDGGVLRVAAVERRTQPLGIAASYLRHAPDSSEVARARAFLGRAEDRWRTLERVGEEVVARQASFVRDRTAPLRDLTRAKVAAGLGLHPSTVSRAVRQRVVALPDGRLLLLSDLFATADPVRRLLLELLEQADAPPSDAALARLLAQRGHRVARRTVAKYRAQLGIAPLSASSAAAAKVASPKG